MIVQFEHPTGAILARLPETPPLHEGMRVNGVPSEGQPQRYRIADFVLDLPIPYAVPEPRQVVLRVLLRPDNGCEEY
jgi:hypothetical protein